MAVDVSATRLKRLHPRLARSGLSNIQTLWVEHENDSRLDKYHHRFDKVLIDAPCTGLGTLRRNPDLKWRQNEMTLKEMVEIQQKLLKRSIAFLKPKGVLVYVTCSILREENQVQVERFLAENPDFCYVDVNELLAKQQIPLSMSQPWFQLWPHQHQTDGFFAAVLTKKSL